MIDDTIYDMQFLGMGLEEIRDYSGSFCYPGWLGCWEWYEMGG